MALEFGSGTQADPWLLRNSNDVSAMIVTHHNSGKYFALTGDLDVSSTSISFNPGLARSSINIDGKGFKLKLDIRNSGNSGSCFYGFWGGTWRDINITFVNGRILCTESSSQLALSNCVFEINPTTANDSDGTRLRAINSIIKSPKKILTSNSSGSYKSGGAEDYAVNILSFPDGNVFNRDNYPTLTDDKWVFDGLSMPKLRAQNTADLTSRFGVKGKTYVGGSNRQRKMAVFTENGLRYKVQDTKADGSFFLNLNDVSTPVIVMAYDDIGARAVINTAYSLNQIIHPAIPNGFRYRCTLAGNSGATIPAEPWSTTTVLTIGAAKFTPEPVYEPKAHGPLLPVLFNVVTEQPV